MLNFPIFPVQASTFAEKVDPLYYILSALSIISTIAIFAAIAYIGIRFRQSKPHAPRHSEALEHPALEITWTVVPTIVFLAFFFWGALLFADYNKVPEGAWQIDVVAKQWMWRIQHPNGKQEINELHVPIGRPVELTMTSLDVLHDFYVPEFRVKNDVIPGRYTKLWFEATKAGEYHLFCAEYCGTEHSLMGGKVYAMKPDDYNLWLQGGPKLSPVDAGAALFEQRGCVTCHTGQAGSRGPDLVNVYGSTVTLTSGETKLADEQYLYNSIMFSNKEIVEGYTPLMPSFVNQLQDHDVTNLIAYIKSLSEVGAAESAAADTATGAAPQPAVPAQPIPPAPQP